MKTKSLFLLCTMWLTACLIAVAQEPVATLEHNGITKVFYGEASFIEAYNASVNGDYIYLSAHEFSVPPLIVKGVKIFGDGGNTTLTGELTIGKGADSLLLEGLYLHHDIKYDPSNSINYTKITRCHLVNIFFQTTSLSASKNYCTFEECIMDGFLDFSKYGKNLMVRNSIFRKRNIRNVDGYALIDGNLFLSESIFNGYYEYTLSNVSHSIVTNNIFFSDDTWLDNNYYNNSYDYNLFTSIPKYSNGSVNEWVTKNGYTGISKVDLFKNDAYILNKPETYKGKDGTPVGIYGGLGYKRAPSNPQIISKTISAKTDDKGNLQINIIVKAQDN